MKNLYKIGLLLLISLFLSCSSDSSGSEQAFQPHSEFYVNGELVSSSNEEGVIYRTEDNFFTSQEYAEGLTFDKEGRFGHISIVVPTSNPSITRRYTSYRPFSVNYFNFNLEELDEVHKRVKVSFSGYVYADPFNLNSESKFISGSFYQKYVELIPVVFGLGDKAKINGNEWSSTDKYYTRGALFTNVVQHDLSEDEYKIMVNYDYESTQPGVYNFSNSDATNKVQLAKYDVQTGAYVNYICNGTMNFTNIDRTQPMNRLFQGTYSFTAVNPLTNETITVTDGAFKLVYVDFP